jgi:hypothetical protein
MVEPWCSAGGDSEERGEGAFVDIRVGGNLLDGVIQVGKYECHS